MLESVKTKSERRKYVPPPGAATPWRGHAVVPMLRKKK
jgi:hypothetical protein